jgi:hypothetical protein
MLIFNAATKILSNTRNARTQSAVQRCSGSISVITVPLFHVGGCVQIAVCSKRMIRHIGSYHHL